MNLLLRDMNSSTCTRRVQGIKGAGRHDADGGSEWGPNLRAAAEITCEGGGRNALALHQADAAEVLREELRVEATEEIF